MILVRNRRFINLPINVSAKFYAHVECSTSICYKQYCWGGSNLCNNSCMSVVIAWLCIQGVSMRKQDVIQFPKRWHMKGLHCSQSDGTSAFQILLINNANSIIIVCLPPIKACSLIFIYRNVTELFMENRDFYLQPSYCFISEINAKGYSDWKEID